MMKRRSFLKIIAVSPLAGLVKAEKAAGETESEVDPRRILRLTNIKVDRQPKYHCFDRVLVKSPRTPIVHLGYDGAWGTVFAYMESERRYGVRFDEHNSYETGFTVYWFSENEIVEKK